MHKYKHKTRNIKQEKIIIREQYKAARANISLSSRRSFDADILTRVKTLPRFIPAGLILCYVSVDTETGTIELINHALAAGKKVAVPRCVPGAPELHFYLINSLDELRTGSFGVPEPNPDTAVRVTDFAGSICFVPGLCFDRRGYRLGYGKGYYDRFLADYEGLKIGLCYEQCLCESLPNGYYDRKVNMLVTQSRIKAF